MKPSFRDYMMLFVAASFFIYFGFANKLPETFEWDWSLVAIFVIFYAGIGTATIAGMTRDKEQTP